MKPAPFVYFAPTSVEETCALLARHGEMPRFWPEDRVWYLFLSYAWRNQKY